MTPPRSVEEWAVWCLSQYNIGGHSYASNGLCCDCARSYAAQEGAQARGEEREACAKIVDQWACSTSCTVPGPCEHIRVAVTIAAAIRARRDEG